MEGQMETTDTTDPRVKMFSPEQIAEFERRSAIIQSKMSGPGKLGLPPLLDERRLEFGLMDSAFDVQAAFDRVLVYQIPPKHYAKGTFGEGSRIVMSDRAQDAETRQAPRGIVVSAGLRALDELKSNGIELGDIVMFNIVQPWRVEYDIIDGKRPYLLVMHSGHLIGSEDAARRVRSGALSVSTEELPSGHTVHVYRDREGKALIPVPNESREF